MHRRHFLPLVALAALIVPAAAASFERTRFAGRFEEAAGLAYKLVTAPRDALDVEAGINFIQQRNLANVTDTFAAGREAVGGVVPGPLRQPARARVRENRPDLHDRHPARVLRGTTMHPMRSLISLAALCCVASHNPLLKEYLP